MRVSIGCVDGHAYYSDYMSDSEFQAEIDAVNGYIFTGDLKHKRVETVEEALDGMMELFKYDKRNDTQTVTLMIDKKMRSFNVKHIVWYAYELDSPNDPWSKHE